MFALIHCAFSFFFLYTYYVFCVCVCTFFRVSSSHIFLLSFFFYLCFHPLSCFCHCLFVTYATYKPVSTLSFSHICVFFFSISRPLFSMLLSIPSPVHLLNLSTIYELLLALLCVFLPLYIN